MELDYRACTLCPRRCGANRAAGELGFCRTPGHILAARAALHYWEELILLGVDALSFAVLNLRRY